MQYFFLFVLLTQHRRAPNKMKYTNNEKSTLSKFVAFSTVIGEWAITANDSVEQWM